MSATVRDEPVHPSTIPARKWELKELDGPIQSFLAAAPVPQTRRKVEPPTSRADSDPLIGQTIGSYEVVRRLGQGGMGTVYLGEQTMVNARVAIKVLHTTAGETFERFVWEARAANAIKSPHVVPIMDFGRLVDGRPYAIMEYLSGRPLDALLHERGRLTLAEVAEICRQTAIGMAAAHREGILHRDLKPENLFLDGASAGEPRVRILDFGIAKIRNDARLTQAGFVLGTPAFCSPEQASGRQLGAATDVYSLGAVAYELLTGTAVFEGSPVDVLVNKNLEPARHVALLRPEISQAAAALIMQMLERDPAARPSSMEVVAARFAELLPAPLSRPTPPSSLGQTLVSGPPKAIDIVAPPQPEAEAPSAQPTPMALAGVPCPRPAARRSVVPVAVAIAVLLSGVAFTIGLGRAGHSNVRGSAASVDVVAAGAEEVSIAEGSSALSAAVSTPGSALASTEASARVPFRASSSTPGPRPDAAIHRAPSRPLPPAKARPAADLIDPFK